MVLPIVIVASSEFNAVKNSNKFSHPDRADIIGVVVYGHDSVTICVRVRMVRPGTVYAVTNLLHPRIAVRADSLLKE